MPPTIPPKVTHPVPRVAHTVPPLDPIHPDEGGRTLRGPTEVNLKAKDTGDQEERLDLGGHVEDHWRESLHTPGTGRIQTLLQRLGRAISASLKGYRRRRTEEVRGAIEKLLGADPPPPQGILTPDGGMVQVCGKPRATTRLGYPRADHSG